MKSKHEFKVVLSGQDPILKRENMSNCKKFWNIITNGAMYKELIVKSYEHLESEDLELGHMIAYYGLAKAEEHVLQDEEEFKLWMSTEDYARLNLWFRVKQADHRFFKTINQSNEIVKTELRDFYGAIQWATLRDTTEVNKRYTMSAVAKWGVATQVYSVLKGLGSAYIATKDVEVYPPLKMLASIISMAGSMYTIVTLPKKVDVIPEVATSVVLTNMLMLPKGISELAQDYMAFKDPKNGSELVRYAPKVVDVSDDFDKILALQLQDWSSVKQDAYDIFEKLFDKADEELIIGEMKLFPKKRKLKEKLREIVKKLKTENGSVWNSLIALEKSVVDLFDEHYISIETIPELGKTLKNMRITRDIHIRECGIPLGALLAHILSNQIRKIPPLAPLNSNESYTNYLKFSCGINVEDQDLIQDPRGN